MDVNPLSGKPLLPYQILVRGDASTGNRVTVVDTRDNVVLPSWISYDGDAFFDNGQVGGTDEGVQQLETVVVQGGTPWVLFLGLAVLGWWGYKHSRGARSWD